MPKHYIVVSANTEITLQTRVENMLIQGWQLQGGVSVAIRTRESGIGIEIYAQAMIKEE